MTILLYFPQRSSDAFHFSLFNFNDFWCASYLRFLIMPSAMICISAWSSSDKCFKSSFQSSNLISVFGSGGSRPASRRVDTSVCLSHFAKAMQVSKLGLCPYVTSSVTVGWETPNILASSRTLIFSALILALILSINSTGACFVVMEYKITDLVIDVITIMVTQLDSFIYLLIMVEISTIIKIIEVHMTSNATQQIIIGKLLHSINKSVPSLMDFLKLLALGFIAALLLVLPWLLKIAAFLVWSVGGYFAIMAIQVAYSPFSQPIEVLALQFAVILVMVAIALLLMRNHKEQLWGGLTLGGALSLFMTYGVISLSETGYGNLILRVLPSVLLATSMLSMTIRLKTMRGRGKKILFSAPLFVWIKKFSKGGDVYSERRTE